MEFNVFKAPKGGFDECYHIDIVEALVGSTNNHRSEIDPVEDTLTGTQEDETCVAQLNALPIFRGTPRPIKEDLGESSTKP